MSNSHTSGSLLLDTASGRLVCNGDRTDLVAFPGEYTPDTPGIVFDVYQSDEPYPVSAGASFVSDNDSEGGLLTLFFIRSLGRPSGPGNRPLTFFFFAIVHAFVERPVTGHYNLIGHRFRYVWLHLCMLFGNFV